MTYFLTPVLSNKGTYGCLNTNIYLFAIEIEPMKLYGSVGLLDFNIWINQNRRKPNLSIVCTVQWGVAKMGQYLKLPKGASPAPGRFLKWVPLATRINWKKTISKKKRFSPKSSFLCRTNRLHQRWSHWSVRRSEKSHCGPPGEKFKN